MDMDKDASAAHMAPVMAFKAIDERSIPGAIESMNLSEVLMPVTPALGKKDGGNTTRYLPTEILEMIIYWYCYIKPNGPFVFTWEELRLQHIIRLRRLHSHRTRLMINQRFWNLCGPFHLSRPYLNRYPDLGNYDSERLWEWLADNEESRMIDGFTLTIKARKPEVDAQRETIALAIHFDGLAGLLCHGSRYPRRGSPDFPLEPALDLDMHAATIDVVDSLYPLEQILSHCTRLARVMLDGDVKFRRGEPFVNLPAVDCMLYTIWQRVVATVLSHSDPGLLSLWLTTRPSWVVRVTSPQTDTIRSNKTWPVKLNDLFPINENIFQLGVPLHKKTQDVDMVLEGFRKDDVLMTRLAIASPCLTRFTDLANLFLEHVAIDAAFIHSVLTHFEHSLERLTLMHFHWVDQRSIEDVIADVECPCNLRDLFLSWYTGQHTTDAFEQWGWEMAEGIDEQPLFMWGQSSYFETAVCRLNMPVFADSTRNTYIVKNTGYRSDND